MQTTLKSSRLKLPFCFSFRNRIVHKQFHKTSITVQILFCLDFRFIFFFFFSLFSHIPPPNKCKEWFTVKWVILFFLFLFFFFFFFFILLFRRLLWTGSAFDCLQSPKAKHPTPSQAFPFFLCFLSDGSGSTACLYHHHHQHPLLLLSLLCHA